MAQSTVPVAVLREIAAWAASRSALSSLTGIAQSHWSNYLNGVTRMTYSTLKKAMTRMFGTPPAIVPIVESYSYDPAVPNPVPVNIFTSEPGLYIFYDSSFRIVYVGKAKNLHSEIKQQLGKAAEGFRTLPVSGTPPRMDLTRYISAFRLPRGDDDFRHDLEALLHRVVVNASCNKNVNKFKRTG